VIDIWERIEKHETDQKPRKWEHQKSGETVEVRKFKNETWDTFHEDTLIENYDRKEEAIECGSKLVGSS